MTGDDEESGEDMPDRAGIQVTTQLTVGRVSLSPSHNYHHHCGNSRAATIELTYCGMSNVWMTTLWPSSRWCCSGGSEDD